ncbi:MAG: hypothetical protein B7Z31_14430 [Rhodobacterales bacterium 12-65-15]|nr:MAG: hypothetical protein B7Z31_14430 [Rhodobacterales bacterium 12-65-15]
MAAEGLSRRDPDGFLWEMHSHQPERIAAIVEAVRTRAEAMAEGPVPLKSLMKRARLYRLGKALGA